MVQFIVFEIAWTGWQSNSFHLIRLYLLLNTSSLQFWSQSLRSREYLKTFVYCSPKNRSWRVYQLTESFVLQLIFSGEYTKAMNKDWHSGHFCCWQCDESLTGNRYVLRDEHPYCIKCYESVFANGCEECNKTIGIDSKVRYIITQSSTWGL